MRFAVWNHSRGNDRMANHPQVVRRNAIDVATLIDEMIHSVAAKHPLTISVTRGQSIRRECPTGHWETFPTDFRHVFRSVLRSCHRTRSLMTESPSTV
jgi:hypothetical protein